MGALIQLLDRPIAYNPAFAKLRAGTVKAGPVAAVFLSQMVYWHNRMGGVWMYKTQADIASETALTRDEQETARKRLVALGVLEEARRGVPATMHYRIIVERLEALLLETTEPANKSSRKKTRSGNIQNVETPQSGLVQSRKLDCGDAANKNAETPQTSMGKSPEQACGDPANFLTGDYTEDYAEIKKTSCQAEPPDDPDQRVLDHFNQVTNSGYRDGKTTMGYIRGRLAEPDYVADDLILVVDYLTAKWLNDPKMCDYLRPKTIFGPENFPEYYDKARKWDASGRPACVDGKWIRPGDMSAVPVDVTERDAAYRRFIGSALPAKNPSQIEIQVRTEASKAGLKSAKPEFAMSRWNSIWKDVTQRQQGGKAA